MAAQGRQERRGELLELLERHAPRAVHEIDEAEVARAEHDDVLPADVVLGPLTAGVPGRLLDRDAHHRVLLVAALDAGDAGDPRRAERPADERIEAVAVALLEGRPLRLP